MHIHKLFVQELEEFGLAAAKFHDNHAQQPSDTPKPSIAGMIIYLVCNIGYG